MILAESFVEWLDPITNLGGWGVVAGVLWWLIRTVDQHIRWMREQILEIKQLLRDIENDL